MISLTPEQKLILGVVQENIARLEALVVNKSDLGELYLSWYQRAAFGAPETPTGRLKTLVKDALDHSKIIQSYGNYNRSIDRCTGCDQQNEDWSDHIDHEPDCPYVKKQAAQAELRKWAETPELNVYTSNFYGHYLGGSAVVIAESQKAAADLLNIELRSNGLIGKDRPEKLPEEMQIVDLTKPRVDILDDGNY